MDSNTNSETPLRSRILGRKAVADISETERWAAVLKAYKGAKHRK